MGRTADPLYHEANRKLREEWLAIDDDSPDAQRHRDRVSNALLEANSRLLWKAVVPYIQGDSKQYTGLGDDLYAAAATGFWQAFLMWDPEKGALSSWSRNYISGAVRREVAKHDYPHLTYDDFTIRGRVIKAQREFLAKHDREATTEELAKATGLTTTKVQYLLSPKEVSLSSSLGGDGDGTLGDLIEQTPHTESAPGLEVELSRSTARECDATDVVSYAFHVGTGVTGSEARGGELGLITGLGDEAGRAAHRVHMAAVVQRLRQMTTQEITPEILATAAGVPRPEADQFLHSHAE